MKIEFNEQKVNEFANKMSELLYEMRIEDLQGSTVTDGDDNWIDIEFVNSVIDNPDHAAVMTRLIRESIVKTIKQQPSIYTNDRGEYEYQSDTYDHAYVIDTYVSDQFHKNDMRTVHICKYCKSDNVMVRSWTNPNDMTFVRFNDNNRVGWCNDCKTPVLIEKIEVNVADHIIGFRVGDDERIYSLSQAKNMAKEIMAVWSNEIQDPVIMYEGDSRG